MHYTMAQTQTWLIGFIGHRIELNHCYKRFVFQDASVPWVCHGFHIFCNAASLSRRSRWLPIFWRMLGILRPLVHYRLLTFTPFALSIRHQTLNINTLKAIEPQRHQHWLIMEPVQIHRLRSFVGGMLVFIPRGDAECVALLPGEVLAVDDAVACALDDVVD